MKKGGGAMSQPDNITGERFRKSDSTRFPEKNFVRERQKLAEERLKLEREKKAFYLKRESEEKRLEEESSLFRMKWKILESELQKLAIEKQALEIEKENNYHNSDDYKKSSVTVEGAEVFFSGIDNGIALKKRYKELIKIYHPDNQCGDTITLQKINKLYDMLKKEYTA